MQRNINAAHALEENEMNGWENFTNVDRVKNHLTSTQFDELFPLKSEFYTYDNFLKAVAKFPKFCDDFNEEAKGLNTQNIDEVCKRELSTLFAHIAFESGKNNAWEGISMFKQGLYHTKDVEC